MPRAAVSFDANGIGIVYLVQFVVTSIAVRWAVRVDVPVLSLPRPTTSSFALMLAFGLLSGLLGLTVVLPLIGHASWHVYRKLIEA